ncbi:peptidoglycan-binding protein [Streptomyces sp. NBC_00878]|uniref:peptidoglycan-binding protein n=1 Tax=Streptomyces sp. NBC_00878 TaxID=2975854 RepID=UPI00225A548A|nr:peptidoglycan-binding protein [Streptomyces sp. NBC_00878]MCX4910860.1 peptidoglycan-binding protein [Streptomyces sp. NBC_00878]
MSRWKALPEELDPRVRQLVIRLRRLKDHSGLSLRQLATKSGYSASSWERYLGGRSLPPREAVEALARISGDEPTRLLVLHEVAAEAWADGRAGRSALEAREAADATATSGATVPTSATGTVEASEVRQPAGADSFGPDSIGPDSPSVPNEETRHGRSLRVALVAGTVALVLAVSSAVLLFVRLSDDESSASASPLGSATSLASPSPSPPPSGPRSYACVVERTGDRWYAGNSRTLDATLAEGLAGPEVAEAQCLLRRAGLSPGAIDGIFGPHTKRAVKQLQKRAGLVVDGLIGPHTWEALRR